MTLPGRIAFRLGLTRDPEVVLVGLLRVGAVKEEGGALGVESVVA